VLGIVAGGAGIVSVAAGALLGLSASDAYSAQKRECASPTDCTNRAQALSDHSSMETDGAWSTVEFIAGGALLAGGAWLFFTGGPNARSPQMAITAAPAIGRANGGVVVRGEF
jgi:hypothetical protein